MAMQPRVPWSMAQYAEAKDLLSAGQSDPEQLASIVGMVEDFERDINDGYTPPAGKQEGVPLRRSAQETGVSREFDPTSMRGQLAQDTASPQESPLALDTDDLAGIQRWKSRPQTTDVNLRSASGEKALYSPPVYTPDPGEIDPSTGLATPGEGYAGPAEPFFHQEPSVAQAIDYIKRAQKTTNDEKMIAQWDVALADMEEHGEESGHWKQFADRQWQEVSRVMQSHRVPVTRIAYQDVTEGKLGDRLEGEFARISEPFIAGADQMATFGVGAEAMAMHGNKRYSQHHEQALAELEESGTYMPMAARTKDVMEASPWITGAGMIAGTVVTGATSLLGHLGLKATAAGGKLLAHATPSLLRGTSMGAQAARGVGKYGVAGGAAAFAEEQARGAVGGAGRAIRGEEKHEIGTPMGPGEAFLAGGIGGTLGGGLAAGVGRMAKNLRLTSDKATREAIGKTEDLLGEGKRGTSWIAGTKETPEMKAILETELRAGTSAGRKTGVEESLGQMTRPVAKLGREEQGQAFKAMGDEKIAFYKKNETNLQSMQESSDRMLAVARRREGTPFADDATFFDAFKKVTDVKPVATRGEADALVKARGGQVMSLGDAKKLFGAKYVKAQIAKLKAKDPAMTDVVDDIPEDAPLELLPGGGPFPTGPLLEPATTIASPIHLVVQGKKLNPMQYDDAIDALNIKIRYGEADTYKDREWKQLGEAIRKDRDQFGGEWGATKKRHEDVSNVWQKRREDFGIKADWNERDQVQLDSIHVALRKAGNVDDATDAQVWALLEKKPALLKKLRVAKATEARRELKSGAQKVTKWGVLSDLAAGTKLRADPILGGLVGDPLTKLGPARLGMLTPPTETVQGMASGSKDLLQRLYGLITGSPEGQDDVSPPSN